MTTFPRIDSSSNLLLGIVQTIQGGFDYNGEANLDLQYAMNLVNLVGSKQEVTLYQVGDIPLGLLDSVFCSHSVSYVTYWIWHAVL